MNESDRMVTTCCGALRPRAEVLVNDVHYTEMCGACQDGGSDHDRHVTCPGECVGPDPIDGQQ